MNGGRVLRGVGVEQSSACYGVVQEGLESGDQVVAEGLLAFEDVAD